MLQNHRLTSYDNTYPCVMVMCNCVLVYDVPLLTPFFSFAAPGCVSTSNRITSTKEYCRKVTWRGVFPYYKTHSCCTVMHISTQSLYIYSHEHTGLLKTYKQIITIRMYGNWCGLMTKRFSNG